MMDIEVRDVLFIPQNLYYHYIDKTKYFSSLDIKKNYNNNNKN